AGAERRIGDLWCFLHAFVGGGAGPVGYSSGACVGAAGFDRGASGVCRVALAVGLVSLRLRYRAAFVDLFLRGTSSRGVIKEWIEPVFDDRLVISMKLSPIAVLRRLGLRG